MTEKMSAKKTQKKNNNIEIEDGERITGTYIKNEMNKVDDSDYNKIMNEIKKDIYNDIRLSKRKSIKSLEELQEYKEKIESKQVKLGDDKSKVTELKLIATKKKEMMYKMNSKKKSWKRNLYHYYYDNPFSRIFRWRYNGLPKVFNEKYFSMSLSMMLFGLFNETDREVKFIKGSVFIVTIPYMILLSTLHKLYLFLKLPYALVLKIKTYGLGNKVEDLFKNIINEIYSNDKYEKLQEYADSKSDINSGEPFYTYKTKKYSFMFCFRLIALFVYMCFRQINNRGTKIGFVDEPGIIILNYTYANMIRDRILKIFNDETKDDILEWFQNNYLDISPLFNPRNLVLLGKQYVIPAGMVGMNVMSKRLGYVGRTT
jgi:hypothetical protein